MRRLYTQYRYYKGEDGTPHLRLTTVTQTGVARTNGPVGRTKRLYEEHADLLTMMTGRKHYPASLER